MTNKEIAASFTLLANLMELHDENAFKIRSYQSAYRAIRAQTTSLFELSDEDILNVEGIGKSVKEKIVELRSTGLIQSIEDYLSKTPVGVVEMLNIKGVGPKKIKLIWQELNIESMGELLYAVNENRLVELKGFGPKVQQNIKDQVEYLIESNGKMHFAKVEQLAYDLESELLDVLPDDEISLVGQIRRKCNLIESIEILTTSNLSEERIIELLARDDLRMDEDFIYLGNLKLIFHFCDLDSFFDEQMRLTCDETFYNRFEISEISASSEDEIFEAFNLPYLIPEMLEKENIEWITGLDSELIVDVQDIKGVVHSHTTYSDGAYSIKEMALASKEKGYEYLVITDHSKSAFYANGLSEDRLYQQIEEINKVNKELSDFHIFSGIESDILNNGDLDYSSEVLNELDCIIASIHSNLRMEIDKATHRLIKAIEHPKTHILGHPTGRLLLSRKAYPIDFYKVIDACSANGVAIEINANPYRLDLDWRYIPYAMDKNVLISINPDAHSINGIDDIHWGVSSARKGGLLRDFCLNAKNRHEFSEWLKAKM